MDRSTRTITTLALALLFGCNDGGGDTSSGGGSDSGSDEVATQGESAGESSGSAGSESSTDASTDASSTDATSTDTSSTDTTTDTSSTDTTTDTSSTDTTTGVEACEGICGSPGCSPCPDAPSVDVPGGYSIASTEVTNAQYAQFLAEDFAPGFVEGWIPSACAFKSDFTPDMWNANLPPDLPVVRVDWCDAWAYCEWSGQHLCGAIGGGPTPLDQLDNPAISEWVRACTGGGLSIYPYGVSYQADACNGMDAGFGQLLDGGSLAGCEGGFPGIFDMSGNVWEWENSCVDDPMLPGNTHACQVRGGSYFSTGVNMRCSTDIEQTRDFRNHHTGIRCCG